MFVHRPFRFSLSLVPRSTKSLFTGYYIRDPSGFIFHNLTREFIDDVILVIILSMSFCLYNKKNITRRLEDMNFIFS